MLNFLTWWFLPWLDLKRRKTVANSFFYQGQKQKTRLENLRVGPLKEAAKRNERVNCGKPLILTVCPKL